MNGARIDPIATEVIGSLLLAIAEEMSVALIRTAYSPNIKERADCSTALFDAHGEVVAQAQRLPLHMGSLLGTVREIQKRYPLEQLRAGDMFLANDPYSGGGSHLPDLNVVAPVFWEDRLVAFTASSAHHSDVGGMVPGSESAACRDIYQEGLRLPPLRLCQNYEPRAEILELVQLNSRTPTERLGDLRAQIAANRVGERGVHEMCRRHGGPAIEQHMTALLDATERRARAGFADLPEGSYVGEERLDQAGAVIRVSLRVGDGRLSFDFDGSSDQLTDAGRNIPLGATKATVFAVVKSILDPGLPSNGGFYRAIDVQAPRGCLVNPVPPAAVSARALTCGVLADAVVGALSKVLPERAVASSGPHQLVIFSGPEPGADGMYVDYETLAGALGARPHKDGIDGVRIYASGASNLPVECLEHAFPLRIERYELISDSGGAGTFRGGLGVRRDYRVLAEGTEVALTGERHHAPAHGLAGGRDGAPARFVLRPDSPTEKTLPNVVAAVRLSVGDVLSLRTPGGAGYGPPEERARESVARDVREQKVSLESASRDYGATI